MGIWSHENSWYNMGGLQPHFSSHNYWKLQKKLVSGPWVKTFLSHKSHSNYFFKTLNLFSAGKHTGDHTNVPPLDVSLEPVLQTASPLTGQTAQRAVRMNKLAHYKLNMYVDTESQNEILLWSFFSRSITNNIGCEHWRMMICGGVMNAQLNNEKYEIHSSRLFFSRDYYSFYSYPLVSSFIWRCHETVYCRQMAIRELCGDI